ncbi:MAG TPA: hypothetical protein VIQ24_13205, partial [Pyrinomonadaceae bacterium]
MISHDSPPIRTRPNRRAVAFYARANFEDTGKLSSMWAARQLDALYDATLALVYPMRCAAC